MIELMVVITIIILLTGGGIIYLNRFNAIQKIETTKDQLITNLRYARNYAVTRQLPVGKSDYEITYVSADLTDEGILTVANDVGDNYFSKSVITSGVEVTPVEFLFAVPDGKLVNDAGVPLGVGGSILISVASIGDSRVVEVNSSGLINEKK